MKILPSTIVARAAMIGTIGALTTLGAACNDWGETDAPEGTAPTSLVSSAGALQGELVVHVFDFVDSSVKRFAIRLPDGTERPLQLPPSIPTLDLPPGTLIEVRGTDFGRKLEVSDLRVLAPAAGGSDVTTETRPLIDGQKAPARKWAFVLLDTGKGSNITKEAAQAKLFGDGALSAKSYYREASYGLQELDGQVFGPFKLDLSDEELCDPGATLPEVAPIRQMIAASGTFNQYLWYYGGRIGCGWEGVAILGQASRPQRDSFYNASTGCTVLMQEPGHNFGMDHSSALICAKGGQRVTLGAVGDTTVQCQHVEYGHPYDPMGSGCGHMNGVQKAYQGWLQGCNIVKVTQSGTFTIFPLEAPCNGIQLLQVPLKAVRNFRLGDQGSGQTVSVPLSSYYLEYRSPVGLDAKVPRGVYVMLAGDIKDAAAKGNKNWLLDATPETAAVGRTRSGLEDAALPVGRTFTDPDPTGPKFTIISADDTKAVVKVKLAGTTASESPGQGSCDDNTPFVAPGPATCSAVMVPPGSPLDASSPPAATPDAGAPTGETPDSSTVGSNDPSTGIMTPTPGSGSKDASAPKPADSGGAAPNDAPPPPVATGGCACEVAGTSPSFGGLPALLVVAGLAVAQRRRRRTGR